MSPSTRRLLKESADLQTNPSPYFHAAPVSESNLFDWHFTLLGPPPPSPYAGGIYHGRITLPPTYPLRPPSFRFLTPSGRFEVNREICLSISGHHEETWQPAWGIRTALIALRSFMDGDAKGQVGGLDVGEEVRRAYARSSRGWRCEGCEGSRGRGIEEFMRECARVVDDEDKDGGGDGLLGLLKTERVRWHPDKIQHRYGKLGIDERVLKSVTEVFQIVDQMWNEERKRGK
ncbi:hypothetical protein CBS147345_10613 [Aspergillus niger]|nr:hypothetical protein CBS147345_10613 [Aspergillus niger]